jgi:hypothetical protein
MVFPAAPRADWADGVPDGFRVVDGKVEFDPPVLLDDLDADYARRGIDLQVSPGPAGPVLHGLRGNWRETVSALSRLQQGEVPGALYHPAVGDIDVIWGHGKTGLKHMLEDRAARVGFIEALPDLLPKMKAYPSKKPNRIELESSDGHVTVSLDYYGQTKTWLLTGWNYRKM